jgi:hypothetical protein
MKKEIAPLTESEIASDIKSLEALRDKYREHVAEGAHLVTSAGGLNAAIRCLNDHIGALKAKAAEAKTETAETKK